MFVFWLTHSPVFFFSIYLPYSSFALCLPSAFALSLAPLFGALLDWVAELAAVVARYLESSLSFALFSCAFSLTRSVLREVARATQM